MTAMTEITQNAARKSTRCGAPLGRPCRSALALSKAAPTTTPIPIINCWSMLASVLASVSFALGTSES